MYLQEARETIMGVPLGGDEATGDMTFPSPCP